MFMDEFDLFGRCLHRLEEKFAILASVATDQ